MPLLVYKISDYEHTAEREQYRTLCKQLKAHYGDNEEICLFIANYNIFDCELDGLIIKQDGIIGVEFKNYGGSITAVENGEWKLSDGTIIKGGSRKTVYQQAKLNHVAIKRGLKEGLILPSKVLKNIATLVVFHNPIQLDNQLSGRTQSWLHICDETNFMEKVQDITSKFIDLSKEDFLTLITKLALQEDFLDDSYSNKDFLQTSNDSELLEKKNEETHDSLKERSSYSLDNGVDTSDERQEIYNFVSRVISTLCKGESCKINVFNSHDAAPLFHSKGFPIKKKYLITVEGENIKDYTKKISRFINHQVNDINNDLIFWEEGDELTADELSKIIPHIAVEDNQEIKSKKKTKISFRKSKTVLPHWLDRYIFNELSAEYAPEHTRYSYNLDLNQDEVKIYLGTYFPRSYAEMFCICDNLLNNKEFKQEMNVMDTITILDIGCGTGGEILGLLVALTKHISESKIIKIVACDGNNSATEILSKIIHIAKSYSHHIIEVEIKKIIFENGFALENIRHNKFNFILCDKMICELISRKILTEKAYYTVTKGLMPLMDDLGVVILLDVTTKDVHSGLYYPQLMNVQLNALQTDVEDIETLIPLSCGCFNECKEQCFQQQTFYISHSHKSNDESRVCYRVMCKKKLKEKLSLPETDKYKHIIHPVKYNQGEASSVCKHSTGDINIDSFNINY